VLALIGGATPTALNVLPVSSDARTGGKGAAAAVHATATALKEWWARWRGQQLLTRTTWMPGNREHAAVPNDLKQVEDLGGDVVTATGTHRTREVKKQGGRSRQFSCCHVVYLSPC
jgi:hypothetical protein